ncbi:cis-isopentenyltransferase, putative [Bodo saltans]|uniref:Cis-isopentenyltransferase, putative n=1 Tax=Bodo saltans TaxID=75058 RepID=A0A0S4JA70_BODSA|nr:cis-isopentenyltransferase, putative [Bodo saltans]|eukprot:CUG86877.1 cis-isopentenyltransferase, putative [Bodo saltans]
MSDQLSFYPNGHPITISRTLSEPQWLVDTLPSSSYNGSIADVDVLVGSFEMLGMSLSLGLACVYFASLWFLYQENRTRTSPTPQLPPGRTWVEVAVLTLLSGLTRIERCAKLFPKNLRVFKVKKTDVLGAVVSHESYGCVGHLAQSTSESTAVHADHGLRHLAVIMDGNRRYGRLLMKEKSNEQQKVDQRNENLPAGPSAAASPKSNGKDLLRIMATSPLNGHRAGGEKLMEVIEHCVAHHIEMLTVYAFSTENWSRTQEEIDVLMFLFEHFFQRIRECASKSGIFIRFISTEPQLLPPHIFSLMKAVEEETRKISPRRIVVNCCVSYGGRSEIVRACQRLADRHAAQNEPILFTEEALQREMLRSVTQSDHEELDQNLLEDFGGVEPQVLLRTSGEARISNFLMYETAYSELVFIDKAWPEVDEGDIKSVIGEFCRRQRRFGK